MNTCKISLSDKQSGCVLNTQVQQPLRIKVVDEKDQREMTFSRVGRVLRGVEVPRDLSCLYNLGKEVGVQPQGDPKISSGRLEVGTSTHNCIIVSFGEGQEYAVFCIHQTNNREIYDLYQLIRETSRSEKKVLA